MRIAVVTVRLAPPSPASTSLAAACHQPSRSVRADARWRHVGSWLEREEAALAGPSVTLLRPKRLGRRSDGRRCSAARAPSAAAAAADAGAKIKPPAGPEKMLENWLRDNGCQCEPLTLRRVQGEGRGLVVASPKVSRGQLVLSVPSRLVVTRDRVVRTSRHSAMIESNGIPDWPALAIWLLEQREAVAAPDGSKDSISWSTYLASLPKTTGSIVEWSDAQVAGCLQGSWLLAEARRQRADFAELAQDLVTLFDRDRARFPPQFYNERQLSWAFSVLLSRLIRLPGLGGAVAIVPWADFLNHSPDSGAFFDFQESRDGGAVVLSADRPYTEGEQVAASYGQLSSGRLLLSYGFVPPPGTCPYDEAGLTLRVPEDAANRQAKLAALQSIAGIPGGEEVCPLRMTGVPSRLDSFARFAALTVPPEQLEQQCRLIVGEDKVTDAVTYGVELAARQIVADAITSALAGYKTTMEADQQEAAQVTKAAANPSTEFPPTTPSALQRAAAAVRVGERRILQRAQAVVQAEIAEIRRAAAVDPDRYFAAPKGAVDRLGDLVKRLVKF